MTGLVCLAFARLRVPAREPDMSDPIDAADAAAALAAAGGATNGHAPERMPEGAPVPA
jgi:hypothetical protein